MLSTKVNIILVLDCCHESISWPFGIGTPAFPEAVREAVATGKHKKLWVLLPASTGQQSLASPWQGGSGFAIHFARGMRGAADKSPFGDSNGDVSLDELTRYLETQVDQWAFSVFGMRQTPVLFPSSDQVSQEETTAENI